MLKRAYLVNKERFKEDERFWPHEVEENRAKYPWRVRLKPVTLSKVGFKELVPDL